MEENKTLSFFKRNLWTCLMVAGSAVAIAITLDNRFGAKKNSNTQDFVTVRTITERLNAGEPLSTQSVEMLELILARHPEIHPQYDTLLGLTFLHQENKQKACSHIAKVFKRGEKHLSPFFQEYAKTSLLITEGKYQEALTVAQTLNENLRDVNQHGHLKAFNLLRIAFLAKKLEKKEIQNEALSQLNNDPCYNEIAQLFCDGSFTLKEYFS